MVLKIEEAFQQKILKQKEDGSPKGKQPVQTTSTTSSTYFVYHIAATTPRLLLWKDKYNKNLLNNNKINI